MTEHLTEQELIDYAYDLAPEPALQSARAHLAGCESCRGRLDALKRKFAALDLLRDEIKPSPALIERAAQFAATPAAGTDSLVCYRFWLSGLAAAIVIGCTLLLISNNDRRQPTDTKYFAKDVAGPEQSLADAPAPRAEAPTLAMGIRGGAATAIESLSAAAPAPAGAMTPVAQIVESPPFAPASAIELVVLPRRENVQLTIYNSADLTLVREKRNLTLKRGWNWLQFMWANTLIDPTSIELSPVEQKDKVQVQQLVFPPRLRELGRWLIHSDLDGQVPFELTYFTSGLAWRAFYIGTLSQDEKTMRLESYVRVDNHSGEEYENAQTRLIVGRIHMLDQIGGLAIRQYPYGRPEVVPSRSSSRFRALHLVGDLFKDQEVEGEDDLVRTKAGLEQPKEVQKEGLSEYFLYTIEGSETIPNEWGKRLLSFKTDDIPVKNLYKYDEERFGDEAVRFLSFKNDTEHKLGTTPIPDGMVRIYGQTDGQKHLAYVGGTHIKYIPVGEEIELDLGPAQLVKVEPKLMDERTEGYLFDSHGDIVGWKDIQKWQIEASNASTLPIDVEITRGFDSTYWELTTAGTGVAYEKYDINHARFKLNIQPRSKQVFTYTITIYRGTQEEALTRAQQSNTR